MGGVPESAQTPILHLDAVGSTSSEALDRRHAGETGPLWVVARQQLAGRGRRGRAWTSEPGNLYASLLLVDPGPPECAPQLCFVAGVALHDAVLAVTSLTPARVGLKWPNDLLIDGAKCAGILVEGESGSASRPFAAVIGLGVNCAHHPEGLPYPATDLAAKRAAVTPERLMAALDATMRARLAEWNRGQDFAAIRAAWLARASGIGGTIAVNTGERTIEGRFETIDPSGALVLRASDGVRRTIAIGDVLPPPAGGAA